MTAVLVFKSCNSSNIIEQDMETGDDDGDEEGAVSADRQPAPNKTAPKKGGASKDSSSAQGGISIGNNLA